MSEDRNIPMSQEGGASDVSALNAEASRVIATFSGIEGIVNEITSLVEVAKTEIGEAVGKEIAARLSDGNGGDAADHGGPRQRGRDRGETTRNSVGEVVETDPLALMQTQLDKLQTTVDIISNDKLGVLKASIDATEGELKKLATDVFSLSVDVDKLRGLPGLIQGLQAQINALKPNYGADNPNFMTPERREP